MHYTNIKDEPCDDAIQNNNILEDSGIRDLEIKCERVESCNHHDEDLYTNTLGGSTPIKKERIERDYDCFTTIYVYPDKIQAKGSIIIL